MRAGVNSWNATVPESLHSVEWAFIDIHQAGMMPKEALSDEVREVGQLLSNLGRSLIQGDRLDYRHYAHSPIVIWLSTDFIIALEI